MRRPIIAGNWKMNTDLDDGMQLVNDVVNALHNDDVDVFFAPPYTHLSLLATQLGERNNVFLAAQNCHEAEAGAYTGEISASMLVSADVDFVILGHSERRSIYNESNELLKSKVSRVLSSGLGVVFCVGERLSEREEGREQAVVKAQLEESLTPFLSDNLENIVIAYEPVWAIGTGKTASPDQAQEMHAFIRKELRSVVDENSEQVRILYGGSVKPSNAAELFAKPDIDGALVGGASLNAQSFLEIIAST